jgi:hypothetical protein
MKPINLSIIATTLFAGTLVALPPEIVVGQSIEKKGTTPYVTHFIFRPLTSIDIAELGKATTLEAVGTTQNMKGEKMLDKMSARCAALNVSSGDKNTSTAPAYWPTATVTRFSRRSILATSISRSRQWIVAPTSSPMVPGNIRGSLGGSHLLV